MRRARPKRPKRRTRGRPAPAVELTIEQWAPHPMSAAERIAEAKALRRARRNTAWKR